MSAFPRPRRKFLLILSAVLAALIAVWLCLESLSHTQRSVMVSTDGAQILRECPQLALTDEELAQSDTVFQLAAVQAAAADGGYTSFLPEALPPELAALLPPGAELLDAGADAASLTLDYRLDGARVILHYVDADRTGHTDRVTKSLSLPPDGPSYLLTFYPALGETAYEKHVTRHLWFGFLRRP